MVILGWWEFLMSEVPRYRSTAALLDARVPRKTLNRRMPTDLWCAYGGGCFLPL